jgi:hypothetical protein
MRSWSRGVDLFVKGRRRLSSVVGRERRAPIVDVCRRVRVRDGGLVGLVRGYGDLMRRRFRKKIASVMDILFGSVWL